MDTIGKTKARKAQEELERGNRQRNETKGTGGRPRSRTDANGYWKSEDVEERFKTELYILYY